MKKDCLREEKEIYEENETEQRQHNIESGGPKGINGKKDSQGADPEHFSSYCFHFF